MLVSQQATLFGMSGDPSEGEENLVKQTLMLHQLDLEALAAARKYYYREHSRSHLARLAMRIGLPILIKDPSKLSTPPLDPASLEPTDPPSYSPKRTPKK